MDCSEKGLGTFPELGPAFSSLHSLNFDWNNITNINITAFEFLNDVRLLSIRRNDLVSLPYQIFRPLTNLEALHLDYNRLQTFDLSLQLHGLLNLRRLTLRGNELVTFSFAFLPSLSLLEHLDLSHNTIALLTGPPRRHESQISSVGPSFTLDLASNDLQGSSLLIFEDITRLTALNVSKNLRLNGANLKALLQRTSEGSLQEVCAEDLRLLHIPDFLFSGPHPLPRLTKLSLARNFLSLIEPEFAFARLKWLRELSLASNRFAQVPQLSQNLQLRLLDLSKNLITHLDAERLPAGLRELRLSDNVLRILSLPDLSQLPRYLTSLHLDGNNLYGVRFPQHHQSHSLHFLNLARNRLQERHAKAVLKAARQLRHLDMAGNQLRTLPWNLSGNHDALMFLNFSNNRLSQLERVDLGAPHLRVLDISWNRIQVSRNAVLTPNS